MNKILSKIALLSVSAFTIYAKDDVGWGYTWWFNNYTTGDVTVNIYLVGRGPVTTRIGAGQSDNLKTGGWCASGIEAQAHNGNAAGLHAMFSFKNMICRGYNGDINYLELPPDNIGGSGVTQIQGAIPLKRVLEVFVQGIGSSREGEYR